MELTEYLHPAEIAERVGRSRRMVQEECIMGRLKSTKVNGVYFIHPDDFEEWKRNVQDQKRHGRPRNAAACPAG